MSSDENDIQTLLSRCSGLLETHKSFIATKKSQATIENEELTLEQSFEEYQHSQPTPTTMLTFNSSKQTYPSENEYHTTTLEATERRDSCMILVFRYLSIPELCRVSIVCKSWYDIAHHPLLWQHVVLIDRPLTSKDLVGIATHCTQTKHITLQGLTPPPATPTQDLRGYLDEQKGSLEFGLKHLLTCSSHLISLSIIQCPLILTERVLWIISFTCPQLEHFYYHSHEFPATPESIWSLSNGCHGIRSLHLHPSLEPELDSTHFTDKCLFHVSQGFPLLSRLTIGGAGITINGLLKLATSLKQLRYLHLINGPTINLNSAEKMSLLLPILNTLIITHCAVSPQAIIKIIDTHPDLHTLQLAISFTDYYCQPSELSDKTCIQKYQKIISNFKVISQHKYYNQIFTITIKPIMTSLGYFV